MGHVLGLCGLFLQFGPHIEQSQLKPTGQLPEMCSQIWFSLVILFSITVGAALKVKSQQIYMLPNFSWFDY